jgi:hypothetical protein
MKNFMSKIPLAAMLAYVLLNFVIITGFSYPAYAAEVDEIEDSDVPESIEKAIEVKEVSEFRLIPLIDITALGTYSKLSGGSDIGGANIRGTVAPALRIDRQNYIIPVYYGSYKREQEVITEEEGGRLYNETMDHNATLEYKHILDEKVTLKINGLLRTHFVNEEDYSWSDGLYDYEDWGAGGSIEYAFEKSGSKRSSASLGAEYYHRAYPNYKSLIALATVTAPEEDEKDYNGYRPILRYMYMDKNIKCSAMYSPLYKDYDDKKVIDTNGVLKDTQREDWFHYSKLELSYLPDGSNIAFGVDLTGIIVDSNQNYYDSKGTVTLGDDVFTDDYYSFKSLALNPKLTYIHKLADKNRPATVTVGYAYQIRDYDNRKIQNVGGAYQGDEQQDKSHKVHLQGVYPLTEHVSLVCAANYTKAKSNMKYETYYLYNYESYFAGAGIRIKY